jgi:hypothetical protein
LPAVQLPELLDGLLLLAQKYLQPPVLLSQRSSEASNHRELDNVNGRQPAQKSDADQAKRASDRNCCGRDVRVDLNHSSRIRPRCLRQRYERGEQVMVDLPLEDILGAAEVDRCRHHPPVERRDKTRRRRERAPGEGPLVREQHPAAYAPHSQPDDGKLDS